MSSPASFITIASGSQYTTQSIGITIDENSHENRFLLAHGAAADIWSIHTLNQAPTTCISKTIRLSEDALHRNCNRKSKVDVEKLWKEFLDDFRRRAAQWSPVRHMNVVRVFGLKEELDLRVEYCPNGTASQYLKGPRTNHTETQSRMIADIVQGVAHLHSQNPPIVHGSINLNKMFVSADGTTKIGEFGLTVLTNHFAFLAPTIFQNELYRWMSPEIIGFEDDDTGPILTTASDIWALGCTLFEIISEKVPYHRFKYELRVCAEILSGSLPGEPSPSLGPELEGVFSILKMCWEFQPSHRPSATELTRLFPPHSLGPAATDSPDSKNDATDENELSTPGKEPTLVSSPSPSPFRSTTPPTTPQGRSSSLNSELPAFSGGVGPFSNFTGSSCSLEATNNRMDEPPISPATDFSLSEERTWEPDCRSPEEEPQFRGRRNLAVVAISPHPPPPLLLVPPPLPPPRSPPWHSPLPRRLNPVAVNIIAVPGATAASPPLPVPSHDQ